MFVENNIKINTNFILQMNKHVIFTVLIVLFSFFSAEAEIRFGAKAGLNLAKTSFNTQTLQSDNFTGFHIGPIVEIANPTGLGVNVAVLYSQQGLKIKELSLEEKGSTLDIPVNLKLKIGLFDWVGIYGTAGPYGSFKLDGNNFTINNLEVIGSEFKQKSFGAGLNFGFGVELLKHFQIGANYKLGLTDDYQEVITDHRLGGKTRIWSITGAYFF
jgi:hypothetical protein